jgi:hypothetical protein
MGVEGLRGVVLGCFFVGIASLAEANGHSVQLDGVYGNSRGCMLARGQEVGSDETFILSPDRFRFFEDECTDLTIADLGDGTFEVSAQCSTYDGEQISLVPYSDRDGYELFPYHGSNVAEALNPCQ